MQTPVVVALDFDGTIAEAKFPELGEPKKDAVYFVNQLRRMGFYIILWTCREGEHLEQIKEWCIKYGLQYDRINEHHPKLIEFYKNDARKICADIYVDDRNVGGLPDDWFLIYRLITRHADELQTKVLDI